MMDLAAYFGSQERSKGAELLRKNLVTISSASDTQVQAFVKGSSACRVLLTAEQVAAAVFSAKCTCPQARRGDLCRHVWAVLLKLEDLQADFLEGKQEALPPSAMATQQNEFKEQQKIRMKARAKELRAERKAEQKSLGRTTRVTYPAPVQEALEYFRANGFPLEEMDMNSLLHARRLLARVFHPDKGGSHDEVLELNTNFEIIEAYLES